MKRELSELELTGLYGLLSESGITQANMSRLTGESQPTISNRIKEYKESDSHHFHRKLGILTLFNLASNATSPASDHLAKEYSALREKYSALESRLKKRNSEIEDLESRVTALMQGIQECFPEEVPVFARALEQERKRKAA